MLDNPDKAGVQRLLARVNAVYKEEDALWGEDFTDAGFRWIDASDAKDKKPGFVSLEGYLVGRTVVAALEKAGKNPTRKALMEALTNGSYDFGGFKMTFGPNDNRGSDDVYLTVIGSDGTFKAVSSLSA